MINLIDELKVVPGVVGACIVNSEDGLLTTNLPAIFKPERLALVGQHLLTLSRSGYSCFPDLTDMTLNYDESVVVARELVDDTVLFAICDPSFNYNLLTMSFNLLQEEFKAGNYGSAQVEPAAAPVTAEPAPATSVISAAMQELLDEMKGLLGKILGPMAGFVFDDVVDVWQGKGAADFSRIDELIAAINQEIDDAEKVDNYRRLIQPLLNKFEKG